MKILIFAVLLCAVTQAQYGIQKDGTDVVNMRGIMPEREGASKYKPEERQGNKSLIIEGIQATHGQFPYMAALYLNGSSFCGGSLISQRWVLTAAHCASGNTKITVYLGAQNLNDHYEQGRLIIETTEKIVHHEVDHHFAHNDIALVNLGQDVPLSEYIQVVKLYSGSELFEGADARVSGWGRTSDASNSVHPQLNYVDVSVISNDLCKKTFLWLITPSKICTRGIGIQGVCRGDSGGPLIDKNSGVQIGIASFVHTSGCETGFPQGFTRVSSYTDWISQNTNIEI